jgi:cobalt-zinc-cadmium efflux system outer membrane protein
MRVAFTALAMAGGLTLPALAGAQDVLTLADVLARARADAPAIASARLAIDEARSQILGASVLSPFNPDLGVAVGDRRGGGSQSTDFDVSLSQQFGQPGTHDARLAAARAQVDQRAAGADETARGVLREAARRFYEAVYAQERLALAASSQTVARQIADAADRRFRAGDIAVLELNIANTALARATADRESAAAEMGRALGSLQALIGIEAPIAVRGDLQLTAAPDLSALLRSAEDRPELLGLRAGLREAQADQSLAQTLSRIGYGATGQFTREGADRILSGGVTLTLPLFARGQERRAAATARTARLQFELQAALTRARIEVRALFAVLEHRRGAVVTLERESLPGLAENESLATRSYDAGQLGLPELLVVRREILDTRALYLSLLLEAALARVDLDAAAAVLR